MNLNEYLENGLVHSIHTSVRRSFRSCRRRWDWAYRQMWYPRITPAPLEFGVAFHKAMEVYYEPSVWGVSFEAQRGLALKAFRDECDAQLKRYRKLNGEPEVTVLNDYKDRLQLGLNMIKYYTETISPVYDRGFKPVRVEVPFEVLITSPQGEPIWCKCDQCWNRWKFSDEGVKHHDGWQESLSVEDREIGRDEKVYRDVIWDGLPVTYGGRLDMLAQDESGRYWIFDWKTTSRLLNEGKEESFLELDDQIASYCWALRAYNIPVAGFVYVEIKKAYPQPPEELTRSYRGRRFSTNKAFFTTHEIYKHHVMANDPDAYVEGLYDGHLDWLQKEGPTFHQRHQIHKNEHEIEEIGRNIYLEALDITQNPLVYPQPGRWSCPSCLYRQPCLGVNQGEDYIYTLETMFDRQKKNYWEIEQPTTE